MCHRRHGGFTLVELLVALAVGMLVIQIAFVSFFFIQKYIRRIERIGAVNEVAQTALLWTISKPTGPALAGYPATPVNGGMINQIGCASLMQVDAAHNIYEFVIHDFSSPAYIHWYDRKLHLPLQP